MAKAGGICSLHEGNQMKFMLFVKVDAYVSIVYHEKKMLAY